MYRVRTKRQSINSRHCRLIFFTTVYPNAKNPAQNYCTNMEYLADKIIYSGIIF